MPAFCVPIKTHLSCESVSFLKVKGQHVSILFMGYEGVQGISNLKKERKGNELQSRKINIEGTATGTCFTCFPLHMKHLPVGASHVSVFL